jgi:hypothetical protein
MKNLKKISREHLKAVKGGIGFCKAGYVYICHDISVCDPNLGEDCMCTCIPYV